MQCKDNGRIRMVHLPADISGFLSIVYLGEIGCGDWWVRLTFNFFYRLGLHIKIHQAGKNMEDQNMVEEQMRGSVRTTQDGNLLYICEICSFKTKDKQSLKKHCMAVHENIKLFKCGLCDFQFAQRGNLKSHILTIHEKLKTFRYFPHTPVYKILKAKASMF